MAVVLLATYSCVQDTTEDLAPSISGSVNGSGEVKTLQVTLPNPTRTEMGDKVDGKYPVFWSEGDVLAVNGEPTTKITINPENKSIAVFDLPLGSTIPYNIVYPYPGEDVAVNSESGLYPVVFSANQQHTEGTFANGAAPMYTWSDGFSDIQMHHLSTILRFPVKTKAGESVTLKYVSVATTNAEPIAGVFDVYCGSNDENDAKAGELKAREGATSTVFYNFENDEFALDEGGEVFYIAVPHGSYDSFELNIVTTTGEVCNRVFSASGDVALKPGRVREFPEIEFSADSKMFLIGTDAEMLEFAEMVKAGTFNTTYEGALLAADVDMTDKGLKTIDGFTSLFEGRHYTISGLTEPLFGENTVGTISNLCVKGNIVEEANSRVGLIARSLTVVDDKVGKVFNCSVEGSIEYKNPNVVAKENFDLVNVGGAVGGVYGAVVSIVKSNVDVTVSLAGPDGDDLYKPCIGGVVGYACAANNVEPTVSECTSAGDIIWDDASTNTKVTPFIGGVAGYVTAGTFADNVNTGELEIREAMFDLDWGGVIGAASVSVERCENKGSMSINEQVTTANIGGVLGKLEANQDTTVKNLIADCENSGKVLLNDSFKIVTAANIGGVVAAVEQNNKNVSGCFNSGSITYKGECATFSPTEKVNNTVLCLGGVVGVCWSDKVENCGNRKSGVIEILGKVSGNHPDNVTTDRVTGIGGVIGSRLGTKDSLGLTEDVLTLNCKNEGNVTLSYTYCGAGIIASSACVGLFESNVATECSNSGNMLAEVTLALGPNTAVVETPTSAQVSMYVSGIFGYVKSTSVFNNCDNSGTVTYNNGVARTVYVSAIASYCKSVIIMNNCSNSGDVTIDKNVECMYVYAGGVIASTKYAPIGSRFPYCSNKGNVNVKGVVEKNVKMGGIFGDSDMADNNEGTVGVENAGSVSFSGVAERLYIGGYAGSYTEKNHSVEFVNTAKGVVTFDGTATIEAFIGGYVGEATLKGGGTFKVVNNGNVLVNGYSPTLYVSGGFAKTALSLDGEISGFQNKGIVEVPALKEAAEVPTTIYLGGIFGYVSLSAPYLTAESVDKPKRAIVECNNFGEVRYHGLVTDGAYIGGVVGKATAAPIYNCINEGKIVSTGNAGSLVSRQFESADKDLALKQLYYHDLAIGGVVGETNSNVLGSTNRATIEHTCNPNPLKIDQWNETSSSRFDIGGVVGRTYIPESHGSQYAITLANLTNEASGNITIYGSPNATTQTSSLDWSSDATQTPQSADVDDPDRTNLRPYYRMNLSGVIGRLHDHSVRDVKHFVTGCTNRGAVEVPDAPYAKNLNISGVLSDILSSYTTVTNSHNYGTIRVDNAGYGTSLSTSVRYNCYYVNLGGVAANCFDFRIRASEYKSSLIKKTLTFNQCTNHGKIYYGENRASFGQSAGGILAQALHWLEGRSGWRTAWCYNTPYSNMTITMNQCENHGEITFFSKAVSLITSYTGTSFAGGMIGSCGQANNAINYQSRFSPIDLFINGCKNYGNIQFDRNNGNMSPNTSVNYSAVGGLVGYYHGGIGQSASSLMKYQDRTVETAYHMEIVSGENHGRIWGFSGHIGGIVGRAHWFAKITGTDDNPTINTGDIVVARNESAGNAVRRTGYGTKVIYAGGIAGSFVEYNTTTQYMGESTGTNEGWPAYYLGSQYARIDHAVNTGAVGATSLAGGIVGEYRSFVIPAENITTKTHKGGVEFCTNTGDIYALEGATSQVGSIAGSYRMMTITENASYTTSETPLVAANPWPIGVRNCVVGGTILRGANRYTTADAENFMNCIYGESWSDELYPSVVEGKEYDGCVPYVAGGDEGSEEEPMTVRR